MCVKPNLDAYVFLKVKKDAPGVLIEDTTGEGKYVKWYNFYMNVDAILGNGVIQIK